MNTSSKTLLATALIAVTGILGAAALVVGGEPAGQPVAVASAKTEIVKLERVVIVGKPTPAAVQVAQRVEQLPRVVVIGKRAASSEDLQVAGARLCASNAVC